MTNPCTNYLDKHPKLKQWVWFVTLWFLGLAVVSIIGSIIKLAFWYMQQPAG